LVRVLRVMGNLVISQIDNGGCLKFVYRGGEFSTMGNIEERFSLLYGRGRFQAFLGDCDLIVGNPTQIWKAWIEVEKFHKIFKTRG